MNILEALILIFIALLALWADGLSTNTWGNK